MTVNRASNRRYGIAESPQWCERGIYAASEWTGELRTERHPPSMLCRYRYRYQSARHGEAGIGPHHTGRGGPVAPAQSGWYRENQSLVPGVMLGARYLF
jgi:hypothetical protein